MRQNKKKFSSLYYPPPFANNPNKQTNKKAHQLVRTLAMPTNSKMPYHAPMPDLTEGP